MQTRRDWIRQATSVAASGMVAATVSANTLQQQKQIPVRTLFVKNLHCEGCAKRLRASVYKVEGVLKVQTNVKNGIALITPTNGGSPSAKALWEAAETQKFNVAKLVTPAGTYEKKPTS